MNMNSRFSVNLPAIMPPRGMQERGKSVNAYFEVVPPGQNLTELRLGNGQQYFYAELPGLGGKGTAR